MVSLGIIYTTSNYLKNELGLAFPFLRHPLSSLCQARLRNTNNMLDVADRELQEAETKQRNLEVSCDCGFCTWGFHGAIPTLGGNVRAVRVARHTNWRLLFFSALCSPAHDDKQ